jgi:hypothetical protein
MCLFIISYYIVDRGFRYEEKDRVLEGGDDGDDCYKKL